MIKPKSSLNLHLFSGFHDLASSHQFQSALSASLNELSSPAFSSFAIDCYSMQTVSFPSFESDKIHLFIGFSAGVIKATIAADQAQSKGKTVAGLIALDGWGVALCDRSFPMYRFSHDPFTHFTSSLLGGTGIFFADPPSEHLTLWAQPQQVKGWYFLCSGEPTELFASTALARTIQALVMGLN